MFKINKKQLDSLRGTSDVEFRRKLCAFLASRFGLPDETDPELVKGVDRAIADARGFGLITQRPIATYTMAAFMCGHAVKDDPAIRRNLSALTVSEKTKTEWLSDWLIALEDALELPEDVG